MKCLKFPTALRRELLASIVNQDMPHHLGGHTEEVRTALPIHISLINQTNIGFVHQRGCLQYMAGSFATNVLVRQTMQFVVYEGSEFFEGCFVPVAPFTQEIGYFFV